MSAWDRSLKEFFRSRIVRLFPAYWFAVLASAAVLLLLPRSGDPKSRPTLSEILTNLTMFEDPLGVAEIDHVHWTLWAEMRFYLIFAVVVWMGLSYRRVLNFSWLWLLAAILVPQSGLPLLQTLVNPRYAPLFIGGIALYAIRREGPRRAEPWALLAITWLIEQHTMTSRITTEGVPNRLSWTVAVGILTTIYLTMTAVACGLLDWVNWRILTFAGALSYPLYLMHQEIGLHLLSLGRGRLATGPLVIGVAAAMVALAWLVHRYVEQPAAKRLRAVLPPAGHRGPPAPQ